MAWAEGIVRVTPGPLERVSRILLLSPSTKHRCVKAVAGFFWGGFLGVVLLRLLLSDLGFSGHLGVVLGGTIVLMLALGNAFSIQIRCITLLAAPALCSRGGRTTLRALVIGVLIAGPLANIVDNVTQVGKVFACGARLAANLTRTRWDLLYRPLQAALTRMRSSPDELRSIADEVREVAAPLKQEVEGSEDETEKLKEQNDYLDEKVGDSKRSEDIERRYSTSATDSPAAVFDKKYRRRLEYRCQGLLTSAANRCRQNFAKAYDKCYDKVSFLAAWLLCWPMKLTFICNMVSTLGGASTCDPSDVINPEFGAQYAAIQNKSEALEDVMDARIQFEVVTVRSIVDIHGADEVALAMEHDIERSRAILEGILEFTKKILGFMVIGILLGAQNYHDQYVSDLSFDNRYVTEYFRKIDARRRHRGAQHLLPLRRAEKLQLLEAVGVWPGASERRRLLLASMGLLLETLLPLAVLLLDALLFTFLSIIRQHGRIDYHQVGHHDLSVRVKGSGLIAQLIRKIVTEFDVHQAVNVRHSNVQCLPRPKALHWRHWTRLVLLYAALWLLLLFRAGLGRLSRAVCAYFYPAQERRRVLRVYNDALKRRWGLQRHVRARVRVLARERRYAAQQWPAQSLQNISNPWRWLRPRCAVCGARGDGAACCRLELCADCWQACGAECPACAPTRPGEEVEEDLALGLGLDQPPESVPD